MIVIKKEDGMIIIAKSIGEKEHDKERDDEKMKRTFT
jgi:hypothetical protein